MNITIKILLLSALVNTSGYAFAVQPAPDISPEEAYTLGLDCKAQQHYTQAFHWFYKAADQGHAKAQNSVGVCYYEGRGVQQDYRKAFEYFQIGARQGYARAACNLGICYYEGKGVMQNHTRAYEFFLMAADQGDKQALCYLRQQGNPPSFRR